MYIDNTYFRGELTVPNSQDYPNSHIDGNKFTLTSFIDEYEKDLMRYGLGNTLFNEFDAIFQPDGVIIPGTDQKWFDFVDGRDYTIDSKDYRWKGLRYVEGVIKKSLIADFIYVKFLDFYSTSFNGVGMGVENPGNASRISSMPRVVEIWNRFLSKYQDKLSDSSPRIWSTSHGLIKGIDWYEERNDYLVTMERYLKDFEVDFPERQTLHLEYKNSFGI